MRNLESAAIAILRKGVLAFLFVKTVGLKFIKYINGSKTVEISEISHWFSPRCPEKRSDYAKGKSWVYGDGWLCGIDVGWGGGSA